MLTSHLFTEQRSLSFAGSKLWNEIPFEIRNADSLNSFKTNFIAYLLTQCLNYLFCGLSSGFQSTHNNNI